MAGTATLRLVTTNILKLTITVAHRAFFGRTGRLNSKAAVAAFPVGFGLRGAHGICLLIFAKKYFSTLSDPDDFIKGIFPTLTGEAEAGNATYLYETFYQRVSIL
jgi:hypothetical protein